MKLRRKGLETRKLNLVVYGVKESYSEQADVSKAKDEE